MRIFFSPPARVCPVLAVLSGAGAGSFFASPQKQLRFWVVFFPFIPDAPSSFFDFAGEHSKFLRLRERFWSREFLSGFFFFSFEPIGSPSFERAV